MLTTDYCGRPPEGGYSKNVTHVLEQTLTLDSTKIGCRLDIRVVQAFRDDRTGWDTRVSVHHNVRGHGVPLCDLEIDNDNEVAFISRSAVPDRAGIQPSGVIAQFIKARTGREFDAAFDVDLLNALSENGFEIVPKPKENR